MPVLGGVRVQVPLCLLGDGERVLAFVFGGHVGCRNGNELSADFEYLNVGRVRLKFLNSGRVRYLTLSLGDRDRDVIVPMMSLVLARMEPSLRIQRAFHNRGFRIYEDPSLNSNQVAIRSYVCTQSK